MAELELDQVTFTYPGAPAPALSSLTLRLKRGEFAVLCGPSGSGKSTLLRLIKREVSPGGKLSGSIRLGGTPLERLPAREAASRVGLVMQHPDNQLVVDTVEHELAFGMENFGLDRSAMRRRMAEIAGFFGLEPLLASRTDELSGGQKQLVNLAAVLMLYPDVLLLDEPTAQLDPLAARELLGIVQRLNEEWGMTVLISEHRIDELLPAADRVIRLEGGRAVFDGSPRAFVREARRRGDASWAAYLPQVTRWALAEAEGAESAEADPPLTVKEARLQWASRDPALRAGRPSAPAASPARPPGPPLIAAEGVFFAYGPQEPAVLKGLDYTLRQGDFAVLFGGNGSGKSTLLQLLAGLRRPQRGTVRRIGAAPAARRRAGRQAADASFSVGYLAQNPVLHFAFDTVGEDLTDAARRAGADRPEDEARRMAEALGIAGLLHRHPLDLSGGEQQLAALGIALMSRPQALLLDEPTKGLDPPARRSLAGHLARLHAAGTTLLVATHDVEFAAECATRCSLLFHGEIVADGEPERFFRGNLFYATALHRLFPDGPPQPLRRQEGATVR